VLRNKEKGLLCFFLQFIFVVKSSLLQYLFKTIFHANKEEKCALSHYFFICHGMTSFVVYPALAELKSRNYFYKVIKRMANN